MAQTFAFKLKLNGADIPGYSSVTSHGREETIEGLAFTDGVETAREAGTGMATGRRKYTPLKIRKRVCKATPLIAKGLCNNELAEGELLFYRPNPTGDGSTEQFFTVRFTGGRVAGIVRDSPDALDPTSSTEPFCEEISFVFETCEWEFCDGGLLHTDDWRNQVD